MPHPSLDTPRLHIRPRTLADLDACLAIGSDPRTMRFLGGVPEAAALRAFLVERLASGWPAPAPGGHWMVTPKGDASPIGWCGIFPLETSGFFEIGYRYLPAAWGKGVATEAARAVLAYGFERIELDPIVAVTHRDNVASQNVLAKIGFKREGMAFYYGGDRVFFRLTRAEYLDRA
jgi:RimJ/RimL family protein N-acetyltransferase